MKENINKVYFFHSIKSFAGSLIGVFIPIYFLQLGFSLTNIFIFWLIRGIFIFVFCLLVAYLLNKFGSKKIIIVSIFLQFILIYLLYYLKLYSIPLSVIALLSAIQAATYWLPINTLFSTHSDQENMGKTTGKFFAWPKIASLPIPIISAIVITFFGFNYLFVISGILYLFSLYPLFLLPELKVDFSFNFEKYINLFKKYKSYFGAEFLENIREEVEQIILPIVVFITFKNVISVGAINTLVTVGGILFTLFIGKLSDKKDKHKLMKIGSLVMVILWLIRMIYPQALVFYVCSIVVGFVEALVLIPFSSIIYTNAKKEDTLEFLLFREFSIFLARIFVYTVAIFLTGNIIYSFIMPIISLIFFAFY